MHRSLFHYDLPQELIARHPPNRRSASRLLVVDGPTGRCRHHQFPDLLERTRANAGDGGQSRAST